ncbi:carboxylating nicotinate-nucleotide diphosphorylase [Spiribacter vilamensis]|uniref:Probable nicotinate-nucleotide pyrophosphorylase [carboxylating] n=1 Tax=Spiribacter vilamensis TaxID=531306 RepID=A0A4Q8D0D3_9GAMM|nr:carboxylating nicotinate-nucleotide diphosphorylase [Spiribacter vilamensis]RZU98769.1 nicotinate-nucleotide pyrophosphorylase [carboxylating] [Spiribacter vilamensis]TVO62440.1 carboxylating nicotinate-nucleotide diphosphorylase [Spiribacter vilamensis]
MELPEIPRLQLEPVVRAALAEDLGRAGDITSDAVIPADTMMEGVIRSRESGCIAGVAAAALAFTLVDDAVRVEIVHPDGSVVEPGTMVLSVNGPARAILAAERVALNLLCHLSGIATATAQLVEAVADYPARIACTRKTTPGLRFLEKHAVRAGGGVNHRFGLDDAMLIKDNHIAVAGGIEPALARARNAAGHLVKIEIEVDTLDQLDEALAGGADVVLLDNMDPATLAAAVRRVDGRAVTEASGRVSRDTVAAMAASGVNIISAGALTHSAPILDLGLDTEPTGT